MSLIELLIAMFITGILLAAVATVFSGTLGAVRAVNLKSSNTADARITLEAMSRTLRVAYQPGNQTSAIASANTNAITFYSLINRTGSNAAVPLPSFVEYGWDGTCITEAVTPGRTNASNVLVWDTGRTVKCLARTANPPVFSYYLTGSIAAPLTIPGTGLTLMSRQTVTSVQVTVNVRDPSLPANSGAPISERITLTNVKNAIGG